MNLRTQQKISYYQLWGSMIFWRLYVHSSSAQKTYESHIFFTWILPLERHNDDACSQEQNERKRKFDILLSQDIFFRRNI